MNPSCKPCRVGQVPSHLQQQDVPCSQQERRWCQLCPPRADTHPGFRGKRPRLMAPPGGRPRGRCPGEGLGSDWLTGAARWPPGQSGTERSPGSSLWALEWRLHPIHSLRERPPHSPRDQQGLPLTGGRALVQSQLAGGAAGPGASPGPGCREAGVQLALHGQRGWGFRLMQHPCPHRHQGSQPLSTRWRGLTASNEHRANAAP